MVCPPKLFVEVIATVLANPATRARKQRNPRPRLQSKGIAMAKATWNGTVLAESNQTVEVEGNQYFPIEAVHREYFQPSNHQTVQPNCCLVLSSAQGRCQPDQGPRRFLEGRRGTEVDRLRPGAAGSPDSGAARSTGI